MSIIHTVIYWTGACVWLMIAAVTAGIACLAVSQWWQRHGAALAGNIIFGLFAPVTHREIDYYAEWDRIAHIPSLHRYCLRRNNNCKRFAYKRLVREARRQHRRLFNRSIPSTEK